MLKRKLGGDEAERERLRDAVEEARAGFERAEEMLGMTPPADSKPAFALAEAEARLAEFDTETNRPLGLSDLLTPIGVRGEFEKLPIHEQRLVLRQIIRRVVLAPGRGKPGERIVVEFQDGSRWPAEPVEVKVAGV
jgi:hypothetical protein